MAYALQSILDLLATRSPVGLVSASTFASIKSLGMILPEGITYGLGFETRLADPSPRADFVLRPLARRGLEIITTDDFQKKRRTRRVIQIGIDRGWVAG